MTKSEKGMSLSTIFLSKTCLNASFSCYKGETECIGRKKCYLFSKTNK